MDDFDPSKKLNEKDFIQEGYKKNPYPFWFWLFLITVFVALLWGGKSWFATHMQERVASDPFLQVTNREISLFLWQFPEHLRANASQKTSYLPAFQYMNKVTVEPELADKYVVAPPEVIFLYHTWNRLLGKEYFPTPIPTKSFRQFLDEDEQWKPQYWPDAPAEYTTFVNKLIAGQIGEMNLQIMPHATIPHIVRRAFQGWQNYYKQGKEINQMQPGYTEMKEFLNNYPNYSRNFWRNIVMKTTPKYLQTISSGKAHPDAPIPEQEFTPFLRAAFYNYKQAYQKAAAPFLIIGPSE